MPTLEKKKPAVRGRAGKSADGKPVLKPGSARGPKEFDYATAADKAGIWWETGDGLNFCVGMPDGNFARLPMTMTEEILAEAGVFPKRRDGERNSESAKVRIHAVQHRRLAMATGALAGYPAGVFETPQGRLMVMHGLKLLDARPGEWPTIRALLWEKLGEEQAFHFLAWCKKSAESLYLGGPGNFQKGPAMVLAGAADCGKSRIQHNIITPLLGGRSADPGPYLFGRTDFNSEMFGAEHLLMEDPASATDFASRVEFGEMLKGIVANDNQQLHRKREDALTVQPFFRLTISINDDPDKLRVLPPLTPDMKDKVQLYHVNSGPLPMPTRTLAERQAFRDALTREMPAFVSYLLTEHVIDAAHAGTGRFGVAEWRHASLADELFDDSPAAALLRLIDEATWEVAGHKTHLWEMDSESTIEGVWRGSLIQLEQLLMREDGSCAAEAARLLRKMRIDHMMGRLKEDVSERVESVRTKAARYWMISRPI